MSDLTALLREGDEKFDSGDYAAAAAAYRGALLAGDPPRTLLANLLLAGDHELLALVRHARTEQPDSKTLPLFEAQQLARMRDNEGAVELYGRLLADASDEAAVVLRLARHQAGAPHGSATLPEDFEAIWKLGDRDAAARPFRRSMLRQLLSIDRPEAIPALQSIAARFGAEPSVAALVTTKIRELEVYAALEQSPLLQRDRST